MHCHLILITSSRVSCQPILQRGKLRFRGTNTLPLAIKPSRETKEGARSPLTLPQPQPPRVPTCSLHSASSWSQVRTWGLQQQAQAVREQMLTSLSLVQGKEGRVLLLALWAVRRGVGATARMMAVGMLGSLKDQTRPTPGCPPLVTKTPSLPWLILPFERDLLEGSEGSLSPDGSLSPKGAS